MQHTVAVLSMLRYCQSMATDADRRWHQRLRPYLVPGVIFSGLAVILGDMAAVSFEHEYLLARGNEQTGWVSVGLAVSIDGLLVISSVAVLWGAAAGLRGFSQLWRPYLALAVGLAATIAANLFSGLQSIALQRAVSVWSGVAVALGAEVVMWFVAARRKLASGETAGRVHPPLPLTLAELLPLARAELRERGEKHGEQELADRFGTTRHRVRSELSVTGASAAAVPMAGTAQARRATARSAHSAAADVPPPAGKEGRAQRGQPQAPQPTTAALAPFNGKAGGG